MRKIGVLLLAAVALVLTLAPRAQAQTYLEGDEGQSLQLLNGTRADVGRSSLPRQGDLDGMARAQAVRMAERGDIYHNPNLSSDADAAGLEWRRLGENVGVGPDVRSIHDAFVASPHHYDNMIWPSYNAIGVGIVPGEDGRIYIAHVFAELAAAVQPTQAPPPPPPPTQAPPSPTQAPPRPTPVQTAVPTPEPRSPDPNALEGGVVNLELVFGVTAQASVDDLVRTVPGLGYRPRSPSALTVAGSLLRQLAGAST